MIGASQVDRLPSSSSSSSSSEVKPINLAFLRTFLCFFGSKKAFLLGNAPAAPLPPFCLPLLDGSLSLSLLLPLFSLPRSSSPLPLLLPCLRSWNKGEKGVEGVLGGVLEGVLEIVLIKAVDGGEIGCVNRTCC